MTNPSDIVKKRIPVLDLVIGIVVLLAIVGLIIGFSWKAFDKNAKTQVAQIKQEYS